MFYIVILQQRPAGNNPLETTVNEIRDQLIREKGYKDHVFCD
jgi:hypothetical protein